MIPRADGMDTTLTRRGVYGGFYDIGLRGSERLVVRRRREDEICVMMLL